MGGTITKKSDYEYEYKDMLGNIIINVPIACDGTVCTLQPGKVLYQEKLSVFSCKLPLPLDPNLIKNVKNNVGINVGDPKPLTLITPFFDQLASNVIENKQFMTIYRDYYANYINEIKVLYYKLKFNVKRTGNYYVDLKGHETLISNNDSWPQKMPTTYTNDFYLFGGQDYWLFMTPSETETMTTINIYYH
jgi:hypothetical protein